MRAKIKLKDNYHLLHIITEIHLRYKNQQEKVQDKPQKTERNNKKLTQLNIKKFPLARPKAISEVSDPNKGWPKII